MSLRTERADQGVANNSASNAGRAVPRIYNGDGDALMQQEHHEIEEGLILVPDALPSKIPDRTRRIRIMWGQHLLEDLLQGRYRTLV